MSKILPLNYWRKYFLFTVMYRLINNNNVPLKTSTRTTRFNNGPVVHYDTPHTTRCQKLPFFIAASEWNNLTAEIRLSSKIDNFKNIIKNLLLEQYKMDNTIPVL